MRVLEHQPPHQLDIPDFEPVIFLAGPIQGTQDWQRAAFENLTHKVSRIDKENNVHIANPRKNYLDEAFEYDAQVEWEEESLFRAAQLGGALFWLANHDLSLPYKKDRAFAQTTRFEFGACVQGWKRLMPEINVALGIDPRYKGGNERYYRTKARKFGITVFDSLDATCNDILNKVMIDERKKV